jgi:hypothetical protein
MQGALTRTPQIALPGDLAMGLAVAVLSGWCTRLEADLIGQYMLSHPGEPGAYQQTVTDMLRRMEDARRYVIENVVQANGG